MRFYDLDGHIIEVGESMKQVIQSFLDAEMSMEAVSAQMDVLGKDLTKRMEPKF